MKRIKRNVYINPKEFFDYFSQVDIKTNECLLDRFHKKDDLLSLNAVINVLNSNPHLIDEKLLELVKKMPGIVQKKNYLIFDGATYIYYEHLLSKMDEEFMVMLEKRKLKRVIDAGNNKKKNLLKI